MRNTKSDREYGVIMNEDEPVRNSVWGDQQVAPKLIKLANRLMVHW